VCGNAALSQIRALTPKPVLISETAVAPAAGKAAKVPGLFAGACAAGTAGLACAVPAAGPNCAVPAARPVLSELPPRQLSERVTRSHG
jgi:hypothetical protein